MEITRQPDGRLPVATFACRFFCIDAGRQIRQAARWRFLHEQLQQAGLDQAAGLENLASLGGIRPCHTGAAIGRQRHQLLACQPCQDRPDTGPRNTECLRQLILDQFGAGCQPVIEQGIDESPVDLVVAHGT